MELRAVLDTNTILAAFRSRDGGSPNRELIERWKRREYILLYSADTVLEYAEKLAEHGVSLSKAAWLLARISLAGEKVTIAHFHFRHYPIDPDDVAFLLCALNGRASHLVTYDGHLLDLRHYYRSEMTICRPVEFLAACRRAVAGAREEN